MRTFRSLGFPFSILVLAAVSAVVTAQARTDDAEGKGREARRILRLRSGQTIRVLARDKDGNWEYHGQEGWRALAPGSVVSAELESDVLRAFRIRMDKAPAGDLGARTRLADWALSSGLAVEGLDEMTAVLALDPDRREALESLATHADVMTVPSLDVPSDRRTESLDALLRFGASVQGAAREFAVNELGKLPRDAGLEERLLAELRSKIVVRRSFAALALRRLVPGQALKPLILHAVLDPSEEVRRDSSLALKAAQEPGVIVPVVRVLEKSASPELRRRAAESLGDMGYPAAVEPLVSRLAAAASDSGGGVPHANIFVGRQVAYVQDFDVEVAQFQAVADPQINVFIEGSTLTAAVTGVTTTEVAVELATARTALERLTKASPGKTSKAWLAWWEANGSKWRSADLSRPASEAAATRDG